MLLRVITPRGYDYVKEELLGYFVDKGYVLTLMDNVEETKKRIARHFIARGWKKREINLKK